MMDFNAILETVTGLLSDVDLAAVLEKVMELLGKIDFEAIFGYVTKAIEFISSLTA